MLSANLTEEKFQENPIINWDAILWVNRPLELWVVQVVLAVISLIEALLLAYLGYKVGCWILYYMIPKYFILSRMLFLCKLDIFRVGMFHKNVFISQTHPSSFSRFLFLNKLYFTENANRFNVLLFQGNIWQQLLSFHFVLEIMNTVPFTFTVSMSPASL